MQTNLKYRLTDKGRTEAASNASMFDGAVRRMLDSANDGATLEQMSAAAPAALARSLPDLIQTLVANGFLEEQRPDIADPAYDVTPLLARPPVEPTPAERKEAERHTIMGLRSLKESGYFVKIVNRADKPIAPRQGNRHVVAIIDGDENNAMLVARALLLAGFEARSAATSEEIVATLNRKPPVDAIVMDVSLPDVLGLELLGNLRGHPFYRKVPVIVMANAVGHDDVLAALAYGARGYLSKPVRPDVMLESVKAVLGLE
jgi:CheY-like chemotaxis protein